MKTAAAILGLALMMSVTARAQPAEPEPAPAPGAVTPGPAPAPEIPAQLAPAPEGPAAAPAPEGPAGATPAQPQPQPGAEDVLGEPPDRPDGPEEPEEELPPVLMSVAGTVGFPRSLGFDDVLLTFGYGESDRVWGGEITVQARILPWLHVGGRTAFRFRHWARANRPAAMAYAPELLGVADARFTVGPVGLGLSAAAGLAIAAVRINDRSELSVAPRVQAAAIVDFPIVGQLGGFVRVGIDYFRIKDADSQGHDADMGGVHLAIGVEVGRDRS